MTTNRVGLEQESRLSDEELNRIADDDHVQCGDASAMARELLAYREASKNPVLWEIDNPGEGSYYIPYEPQSGDYRHDLVIAKLYAAPPIQAVTVPDEMVIDGGASFGMNGDMQNKSYGIGWNACRAAMLKGTTK